MERCVIIQCQNIKVYIDTVCQVTKFQCCHIMLYCIPIKLNKNACNGMHKFHIMIYWLKLFYLFLCWIWTKGSFMIGKHATMELHPWVQYWIEQSNSKVNTERRVYMVDCVGMEIVFMDMFICNKKIRKELVLHHSIYLLLFTVFLLKL